MKTHLDSGNSKHDVIAINPSSSCKLQEDRMWEAKDILKTESMKLALEYRRKEINKNDMSVLKLLIITRFSHTNPTGCLSKEISSKSKQVIIYV